MQRNLEVIRDILLAVEATPDRRGISANRITGHDPSLVSYNMSLLIEEGFIDGNAHKSYGGPTIAAVANSLTWTGHELLDAIRDKTIWAKTTDAVKRAGAWTMSSVLATASALATEAIRRAAGL